VTPLPYPIQRPDEEAKGRRIVFTRKGTFEVLVFVESLGRDFALAKGTFGTNPAKNPKTIDLAWSYVQDFDGKFGKAVARFGIYERDGEVLRICQGPAGGKDRPAAFTSKPGSGHTLFTLRRKQP
jgi:uncharacterized protein (TIGR03067 family)